MQAAADIARARKQTQSSLQIAANSIIENNNNRPPNIAGSVHGLPPKNIEPSKRTYDGQGIGIGTVIGNQGNYTEGDSLSQSLEDSGQLQGEMILEQNTDDYITNLKKGNANILVGVRCRPLSKLEKQKQSQMSVKILDEKIIILQDVSAAKPEEARSKEKTYAFDYAFNEDRDQQYIFDRTTKFLIEGIMQGYNASVFAYGSTGAGKTYTMLGTEENPGIMLLSIEELFNSIENLSFERDYKLKISYVEVYNENIKDLLTDKTECLDLREDTVKGVCVAGVTEIMTTNVDEIMRYIRQGNRMRTKERTDANEASSRSHAVLQITVEHKDKAHGINAEINIAKLSLIDLAGSERASNTNNRGIRLVEGANINKSLLALGNCINALCEQTKMGPNAMKNQHIPYRDSKLTRLLKDSLGGNCRTVMIANISPAFTAYEDTLNTLKYADRAKQIKTIVKRNVLNVEFHISNYTKIINQLREEIVSLRQQLQVGGGNVPAVQPKNPSSGVVGQVQPQKLQQNQSIQNQNKLKSMKIDMNIQFEKEVTIKKEIYELDMKNEDLAFKLFSKQMLLTKNKGKAPQATSQQIEQEVKSLKGEIDINHQQKAVLNERLVDLENQREKMIEDYQQQMLQYEIEAIDVLYNQHLLNLKQIDIKRKENRAEFHIRQRDNYIQHLKEQLSLRDRIIKEKLGLSITNFMPGGNINNSYNDNSFDILTMQDIDKMSKELILPSLNMTKSSSFIPNTFNSPLDNPQVRKQLDISDSPYSHSGYVNQNTSPNQRMPNVLQNKTKNGMPRSQQQRLASERDESRSEEQTIQVGYTNQLKLAPQSISANQPNSGAYYNGDAVGKYQRPSGSSMIKPNQMGINQQLEKKGVKSTSSDINYDGEVNTNISFQSHRNNSNSRIGIGINNAYNQQQQQLIQLQPVQQAVQPPGTSSGISGVSDQPTSKSFASEMSKNKQKFLLMQKQQIQSPQDVFQVRNNRAIPKNPLSINKKLSLLKKNLGSSGGGLSSDEATTSPNIQMNYQSSRNQSQNPVSRVSGQGSNIMQQNGNQIATGQRRISDQNFGQQIYGGSSVNNSLINIADNL